MSRLWRWGLLGALLLILLGAGYGYRMLYPSGTAELPTDGAVESARRDLPPFDSLVVDGPFTVTLADGAPSLTLAADSAVAHGFVADIRGRVLRLYLETPVAVGTVPHVTITASALQSVELTGSARLEVSGGLAPAFHLSASDASSALLRGGCTGVRLEATGAAEIDARGLDCPVTATDAGPAAVIRTAAQQSLDSRAGLY